MAHFLQGACDGKGLHVLAHVMDAEDRRAALVGERRERHSGRDRARQRFFVAQEPAEEALARGTHQHGPPERDDLVQAGEQLEVVLHGLAEADPGVEADSFLVDAGLGRELETLLQEGLHLGDDVVVARIFLHRARLAEHVHQAQTRVRVGDDACDLGLAPKR